MSGDRLIRLKVGFQPRYCFLPSTALRIRSVANKKAAFGPWITILFLPVIAVSSRIVP